jgi:hypothetical protein
MRRNSGNQSGLVKVAFRDDESNVETLWAFDLGGNRYRLDNTPWYQYGVSFKDVIEALPEEDGMRFFTRVVEKSGFRTVRVRDDTKVPEALLQALTGNGCAYEGANPGFIAIDIPPEVGLEKVVEILVRAEAEWEHADPTYEQLHGSA